MLLTYYGYGSSRTISWYTSNNGPVIENGFYYDFARKEPSSLEDLEKLKKMSEIIDRDVKTKEEVWEREKQLNILQKLGKNTKLKLSKVYQRMRNFIYHHGDTWHDLCRGPFIFIW